MFDLTATWFGIPPTILTAAASVAAAAGGAVIALVATKTWRRRPQKAPAAVTQKRSSLRAVQRGIAASVLATVLVTVSACDLIGVDQAAHDIDQTVEQTVNKTITSLDSAISQLTLESTDWRNTLTNLEKDMTDKIQKTVRDDLARTLDRASQAFTIGTMCTVAFAHDQVRDDLIRIKAAFQRLWPGHGQVQEPDVTPHACLPDPATIRALAGHTGVENGPDVQIQGYNFVASPNLTAVLLADGAAPQDVTSSLAVASFHLLTLNFSANGVPVDTFHPSRHQVVEIRWQGRPIGSAIQIAIVIPPCATPLDLVDTIHTFTPALATGDTNFGGSDVLTQVRVTPGYNATEAWIDTAFGMWEIANETSALGYPHLTLYTAPAGYRIASIENPKEYFLEYTHHHGQARDILPGGGWVTSATAQGFDAYDAAGDTANVTVHFTLRIHLVQDSPLCAVAG